MSHVALCGMPFSPVTERQLVAHVIEQCSAGHGGWVVTPNLDVLRQCAKDEEIGALVRKADVVVADGMPLIWASRWQGTPLPERVCGSNIISSVAEAASSQGLSIFLLGGDEGTAVRAKEVLEGRHPDLRVVGTYCPPFGFERDDLEIARIAAAVRHAAPDIVFVALSFPKCERLIARIRHCRRRAWWIGVGISFSFLSGDVRRAPRWMQSAGLEWAHRLTQEPRKLARRYLIDDAPFALRLFWSSTLNRSKRDSS